MVLVLAGAGVFFVASGVLALALCAAAGRADEDLARRWAEAEPIRRAIWEAGASEIERLDQVFTGSQPWNARPVR